VEGGDYVTRITKTVNIRASPEKVFAFMLSDKMNEVWGRWLEAKWISEGPIGVGSVSHWTPKQEFKIKGEWDEEIVEFEKNRKIVMRTAKDSKLNMTVTGLFEPTTEGTKLTYIDEYEVPYSLLGKLVDKVKYSKDTEKFMEGMLENLKQTLED
jgi:uncharacterized protein YndB with AHSA1/START domain